MENEKNLINVSQDSDGNDATDTAQDYLSTIMELKKNTVSKDEYNKLREENKNLLQTLVEGGQLQKEDYVMEKVDIDALRKELFSEDCELNNLQYIEKTLKLRNALIDSGEPDPFLPVSSKNSPTIEEINKAENAAQVFQECIDYADGDSQIFTQELMRRTNDSMPMNRAKGTRR